MGVDFHGSSGRLNWTPLIASVGWLLGSFALFLLVGKTGAVSNLGKLSLFILCSIALFAIGYATWVKSHKIGEVFRFENLNRRVDDTGLAKLLVAISALYYLSYGLIYMAEFGVSSPQLILGSLSNPGAAYQNKFGVYEAQLATGRVSAAGQVITLAAPLSAPLVPLMVIYWKKLTADVRVLGVLGLSVYALFFLSIGTLAGLGSVLTFAGVSLLVLRARSALRRPPRKRSLVVGFLLVISFVSYMSYNQGARVDTFDIGYQFEVSPALEAIVGQRMAVGLVATSSYPTQGYQGLSYNLDSPFVWTKGRGASRALDSYWSQYGLGESVSGDTYPARTERRTGWPAGQYWATIYPWLASDLTFPGAAFFMFFVGRWLARLWKEAVYDESKLSLMLLCQLGLLIAFVPANNQLGIGRPAVICLAVLLSFYVIRLTRRRFEERKRPRTGESRVSPSVELSPR